MTSTSIADLRKSYERAELNEDASHAAPLQQFDQWLKEAISAEVPEPNAMTLATVGSDLRPSTRIVLIKGYDERGIVWFTNYDSRKGRQIAGNPYAALQFLWVELERVVRIEGVVPGTPYRGRVRRIWGNLLRHRLDQYAEVVFQEQYYNSPWFTQGNREFSTRLMAGFFALMEEGQQQEILKAVPIPLLTASLVGSVRETGNLIRTRVLPDDAAVHQMAFGLCWDAIKA